jgi:hypothetical protein
MSIRNALSTLRGMATRLFNMLTFYGYGTVAESTDTYGDYKDFYLQDLVPYYFEDTMFELRVIYTMDYQLTGLASALGSYCSIDENAVIGEVSSSESVSNQIDDIAKGVVEDFLNGLDDKALICKNFWNGKELM